MASVLCPWTVCVQYHHRLPTPLFPPQECSWSAFAEIQQGLQTRTPATSDLRSFHYSSFLSEDQCDQARSSETGLACFVRTDAWRPLSTRAWLIRDLLADGRHGGAVRHKLKAQGDGLLMLSLEHVSSGARVCVTNTHLYWNPNFPHIKAAQAELVAAATADFAAEQRPAASERREGALSSDKRPLPAVVIAGDLNSVPFMQPHFLPEAQRAALPEPLPEVWRAGAVYDLFAKGSLPPDHPEHPDTFGQQEAMADGWAPAPPKRGRRRSSRLGELSTGLRLRDAYASAGSAPLPLTTNAGDFAGCLDYIWVRCVHALPGGSVFLLPHACSLSLAALLFLSHSLTLSLSHSLPLSSVCSDSSASLIALCHVSTVRAMRMDEIVLVLRAPP